MLMEVASPGHLSYPFDFGFRSLISVKLVWEIQWFPIIPIEIDRGRDVSAILSFVRTNWAGWYLHHVSPFTYYRYLLVLGASYSAWDANMCLILERITPNPPCVHKCPRRGELLFFCSLVFKLCRSMGWENRCYRYSTWEQLLAQLTQGGRVISQEWCRDRPEVRNVCRKTLSMKPTSTVLRSIGSFFIDAMKYRICNALQLRSEGVHHVW